MWNSPGETGRRRRLLLSGNGGKGPGVAVKRSLSGGGLDLTHPSPNSIALSAFSFSLPLLQSHLPPILNSGQDVDEGRGTQDAVLCLAANERRGKRAAVPHSGPDQPAFLRMALLFSYVKEAILLSLAAVSVFGHRLSMLHGSGERGKSLPLF